MSDSKVRRTVKHADAAGILERLSTREISARLAMAQWAGVPLEQVDQLLGAGDGSPCPLDLALMHAEEERRTSAAEAALEVIRRTCSPTGLLADELQWLVQPLLARQVEGAYLARRLLAAEHYAAESERATRRRVGLARAFLATWAASQGRDDQKWSEGERARAWILLRLLTWEDLLVAALFNDELRAGRVPGVGKDHLHAFVQALEPSATRTERGAMYRAARADALDLDSSTPNGCATPTTESSQPENSWTRQGKDWIVTFAGERTIVRDGVGIDALLTLLGSPGHSFDVETLLGTSSEDSPGQLVSDREAMRKMYEEMRRIQDSEDPADRLELEQIHRAVRESSWSGDLKRMGEDAKRARDRLQSRIRRVIEKVSSKRLKTHLRNAVCPRRLVYQPDDLSTTWMIAP